MSLPPPEEVSPLVSFVAVQLKYGCGDSTCMNPHCRSSPNFRHAAFFTSLQGISPAEANQQIAALAKTLYDQNKGNALCLPSVHQTLAMWISAIDKLPNSPTVPLNHRCWRMSAAARQAVTDTAIDRIRESGLKIKEVVDLNIIRTTVECNLSNFDSMRRFCQFHSREYASLECDFDSPCFSEGPESEDKGRSQAFLERLYADVQQNAAFYSILLEQEERERREAKGDVNVAGPTTSRPTGSEFRPLMSEGKGGPIAALLAMLTQSIGDISTLFDVEPDIACEPKHVPVFVLLLSLPERLFLSFPEFFQNVCQMIRSLSLRLKVEFVHLLKQYCEFLNRKEALKATEFVHQVISLCQQTLANIMTRLDRPPAHLDATKLIGEREVILAVLDLMTIINHVNVRGRGTNALPSSGAPGREALRVFSPDMIPSTRDLTETEAIDNVISRALDPHSQVPTSYVSQHEFETPFLDSLRYNYGPDMEYFLSKYRKLTSDSLLAQLASIEPAVVQEAREAEERRRAEEAKKEAEALAIAATEARGVTPARSYPHPLSGSPDSPSHTPLTGPTTSWPGVRPLQASSDLQTTAFGDMNSIPPEALSTDQSETDDARPRRRRVQVNPMLTGDPLLQILSQVIGIEDHSRTSASLPEQMFTFLQYPFVLSAAVKAAMLRFECRPQLTGIQSRIFINRNDVVNDTLNYIIGHSDLDVADSWRSKAHRAFLRVPLNVTFDEEEGIDDGGLKTEFFNLLCDELFSQKYGLFDLREGSNMYYWKKRPELSDREEAERLYCFAGMVFAMSVLNQVNVNNVFPHVFYKKLLGDLGNLEDLAGLDPELYRGLCTMWYMGKAALAGPEACRLSRPTLSVTELLPSSRRMGKTGPEHQLVIPIPDPGYDLSSDPIYSTFCATFTAPAPSGVLDLYDTLHGSAKRGFPAPAADRSAAEAVGSPANPASPGAQGSTATPQKTVDVELVPGGSKIPVCLLNFAEYIVARTDYEVNASVAVQFQNFQEGFMLVAGSKALTLFNSSDLEVTIVGEPTLDFEALRGVTTYQEPFSASHQVVRWFWDVVINDFTEEERRQLLKFVTGSARAPVGGLGKLPFRIFPNGESDIMLPTSHTCYNVLMLPRYSSRQALEDKLRKAVGYCEGFGLK